MGAKGGGGIHCEVGGMCGEEGACVARVCVCVCGKGGMCVAKGGHVW